MKILENTVFMWINSIFITFTFGMLFGILQFLFRYLNIVLCKMTKTKNEKLAIFCIDFTTKILFGHEILVVFVLISFFC